MSSIITLNVFISAFLAWAYLYDGASFIGVFGLIFLFASFLLHISLLVSTSISKRPELLRSIVIQAKDQFGVEKINKMALARLIHTSLGSLSSLISVLVMLVSGLGIWAWMYLLLSGTAMWSIASLDDKVREALNKNK